MRTRIDRTSRRLRRRVIWALALVAGALALFALLCVTGLPGPARFRRYPVHDLNRVADVINQSTRTGLYGSCHRHEDIASVDVLRSRVVVIGVLPSALSFEEHRTVEGSDGSMVPVFVECDTGL